MCAARGYTLMELAATVSIVAILTAVAVPSFATFRQNAERTAAVNAFFHALFLARSEAVKSGRVVSLCKSADGRACSEGEPTWSRGWMVFINRDGDDPPVRDPGEKRLFFYPGWNHGEITSNRSAYSFRPLRQGVVNGTIVFCDARGPAHARAIIISHTGRPRISRRDASNRALRCAGRSP